MIMPELTDASQDDAEALVDFSLDFSITYDDCVSLQDEAFVVALNAALDEAAAQLDDEDGDEEDPLAGLLIELDLPSDAEDKLVNSSGAPASSATNLARNKALVAQALQRVLTFIGPDAEAPTSVIEDSPSTPTLNAHAEASTLYPSASALQTHAYAQASASHPFYIRKKTRTRKLVAHRSLPQWHDLDVGGALYAAFSYLQSLGSAYAFSLELDDATRAQALAKGSSWLRARLVRRLDQCLGHAVPFLLAAELKTSNGDRLHFHGLAVVSPHEIPAALQALALAGGSSWTPKRGGERQAYVSKSKDGAYRVADAGWIGYLTKHAAHTAKHLGGPIIAMPLSVREGARQSFEDWRAQETAREARGEEQGAEQSPTPAEAEDRAGESLRLVPARPVACRSYPRRNGARLLSRRLLQADSRDPTWVKPLIPLDGASPYTDRADTVHRSAAITVNGHLDFWHHICHM